MGEIWLLQHQHQCKKNKDIKNIPNVQNMTDRYRYKKSFAHSGKNMVNKGTSEVKSKSEQVCGAIQRNGRFTVINCC